MSMGCNHAILRGNGPCLRSRETSRRNVAAGGHDGSRPGRGDPAMRRSYGTGPDLLHQARPGRGAYGRSKSAPGSGSRHRHGQAGPTRCPKTSARSRSCAAAGIGRGPLRPGGQGRRAVVGPCLRVARVSGEAGRVEEACVTCGAAWSLGEWSADCAECAGGALKRACPVRAGRCGAVWRRAIMDSRDFGIGHWLGPCGPSMAS